jgi:transcriptional regulator with XRE-family HTH domain
MTIAQTGVIPEVTVGHRIRIAREYAGLEQGQLAELADMSRTTVVNYEAGHRQPRRLYLRSIAQATGVDVGWLETGMAPAEAEAITELSQHSVRPKGLEPLTFWIGATAYGLAA